MDKARNYLSLARKAGRMELGEEPAGAVARAQKARLLIVAQDAGDHTWRRAQSFAAGQDLPCIRLPYSKDELGQAIGRQELALAAITDPALALAFVKALEKPEQYKSALESLDKRTKRVQSRQAEAKAHQKNVKTGRKGK